jgi:energy-coupling factor transporter ATP-binding protein EcfA2
MMRIHRIRIANVAGVGSREVALADRGITLISGQNESGKSTLFLALQALLDHPDDASHREVKALKPLHTGLTPEVEADLTIGRYRLTYTKSFGKGKAGGTRLRIDQPTSESLTGREAHDRVTQIIDQNLDRALWDAMRISQGAALGQPTLAGVRSLSSALDQAVGNDIAGEREDNLLNRSEREFLQYWTPGGKPNQKSLDLEIKASNAEEAAKPLRAKLRELEADIAAYKGKKRELATANGQTASLAAAFDKAVTEKARLDSMSAAVQLKNMAATAATHEAEIAQSALVRRQRLTAELTAADAALEIADQDRAKTQELPTELAARVARLDLQHEAARSALNKAAAVLDIAESDVVYQQNLMDLKLLDARMTSIDQADRDAAEAETTLKSLKATKETVAELTQAATAIAVAKAKLSAASPKVLITALADTRVLLNGSANELGRGQTFSAPRSNVTLVTIGTIAEVVVEGANDVGQLERELKVATADYDGILERLGVTTVQEAEDQRQRRDRAVDQGIAARRAATEHLLDLNRESMREKIKVLREASDRYPTSRSPDSNPMPDSLASAKSAAGKARGAVTLSRPLLDDIEAQLKSASAAAAASQTAAAVAEAKWASQATSRDQLARSLASVREERTDAELEADADAKRRAAAAVVADRDNAKAAYEGADPAMITAGFAAAEKARTNHEANLRRIHDEVNRLKVRLEVNGEAGVEEQLQKAERDAFLTRDAVTRFARRAQAAKLLYETLQSCREEARKSYVAPLKSEIERLGKLIFGEEFGVVIGENLNVEARVMNGTTIPYASLSSGTKEQIGILERLATARIVGKGGVPLLLDDAVAYTDNVRQESLAAALGFASADSQTIVVTCAPEKYAHAPIEARIDF